MKLPISSLRRTLMTLLVVSLFAVGAIAQTVKITGKVTDSKTGEGLPGVSVILKGTQTGTATDINGMYSINAPKGATLDFTFVGYNPASAKVEGTTINIQLVEATKAIDEVVVIGYGRVKKNDVTGSVTAISTDKMVRGAASSASDMLVGKVAGVSVITDGGAPGAGATIRVRGGSSMSASNDPLIVIDGVPVDNNGINGMANPLSTVHPNDIETFTVLKDASATAIYGSRASNGVIIITTKKGQSGKLKVDYSGTFSISAKSNSLDVMSADQFRAFVKSKFAETSEQVNHLGTANTNWQDQIFRTAFSHDHNVSVSGSIPQMPYRVSVSYTNEDGILKTSNMERVTGAVNLNPSFFDKMLNVQMNVKGVYNTNRFADRGSIGLATQYDPTQPIYMSGSQYGNGYFMYLKADGKPIDIGLTNPVALLEQKNDKSTVYRSIGNIQADYKFHFLPELRANLNMGYDISKSNGDVVIADNSPITWTSGNFKTGFGENSHYTQTKRNTLLDFYLNYNKTIGIHSFDAMAGYSWQRFYNATTNEYPYSAAMAAIKGQANYKTGDDYSTENYLVSFFGRLNYTLMDRYLLTLTVRNDGSSRFNPDNRWGLFPSAAFAWRINKEEFLKDASVLSDLKLRLGYGITGQQNLGNGDYPYMARYVYSKSGANYYFGDEKHPLIVPVAYDANLKWEETTTYNVGLDFGFLGGRINGTLDVYRRTTKDLLNTVTAPAGSNFSNVLLTNVGTLENNGVEFTINGNVVKNKDWNWTLGYNITYNKNEITKMTRNDDPSYVGVIHGGIDGATGYNVMIHAVNKPFNSYYVFEQLYDKSGKPIENAYVDQNGDNKIDDKDLIAYKKSAPDVFMGFTSQLSYKNWDLAFALRASIGNYVYNNVQSNREAYAGANMYDPSGFLKNRLTSASFTNFANGQYRSSYYVQDASFVRMDNITLGYNFSKIFNTKQRARVYATVQNPFVITNYSGLDPEVSGGIDNNTYPRPRVFLLGLNLNF